MTKKPVSVIIVNYNAGFLLKTCVDALIACPVIDQIIIVDNASSDGSINTLVDSSQIVKIFNDKNLGFAVACNQGMKIAQSDYLLFLNPDCKIDHGAIQKLLETLSSNNTLGMVGGCLCNPDGSEQAGGRRAVPTPWRSFVRAFGLYYFEARWPKLFFDFYLHKQPLPTEPIEVEAISGACMMVKRQAVDEVGFWDESYFLHCEDLDWCMRFRQKGWKIFFVPDAKVIHIAGTCSKNRPIFVEWHKHKGMLRFYHKFFRHQYPGILMVIVTLGVCFRFALVAGYYSLNTFINRIKSLHV